MDPNFIVLDLVKDLKNKTAKSVEHLAIQSNSGNQIDLLADILMCYGGFNSKTIVFTQTKSLANDIMFSEKLKNNVEVLHGDISQYQREITLRRFKEGKINVLVATDVAARGLDVPNVDLVIQLEPPKEIEAYIHRSGRTARAGNSGKCITFFQSRDNHHLKRIEQMAGISFKRIGAPQPEDVIKQSASDIHTELDNVDDEVLPLFKESATKLILEKGALNAVSMALAYISGATEKFKQKSLQTGEHEKVTLQIVTDK